ncbi:MAG: hypothetical protein AAGD43_09530 [Pseudomonadota bacterium]
MAASRGFGPLPQVGGPDTLTQNQLAKAAFKALGKPPKLTHLPDFLRRGALKLLPYVTPAAVHGPALFFLSALGMNMVGKSHGSKHVAEHFAELAFASSKAQKPDQSKPLAAGGAS